METRQSKKSDTPVPTSKDGDKTKMAEKKELTLQDVIDSMKGFLKETEERIKTQIKENSRKIEEGSKKATDKLEQRERSLNEFTERVVTLEQENHMQAETIKRLVKKVDIMEQAYRSHNIILEGLSEDKNENLRKKIDELFEEIDLPFDSEWTDTIHRIGVRNEKSKRPRAVKVNFPFLRYRNEFFRKLYKLKHSQKYKRVYVVDDFPPEMQDKIKDLRAINAYARSKGLDTKMKGAKILIDGKAYSHDDIVNLAHNLSMEAAKLVEVEDGVAFQGKYAFLSNRHPCDIQIDDKRYNSSEKAYQYTRAVECDNGGVAHQIYQQNDIKEITRLSKLVKDTPEWKAKVVPTIAKILRFKFDQNQHLKDKLCRIKGHMYEATLHPVYGCGFTLAQHDQINKQNTTAGNKLGKELDKLRDEYIVDGK